MTPAERMQEAFHIRPRLIAFRAHVDASVPCVPDNEETRAALRNKRVDDALGIYLNYASRFVPSRPRQVGYAPTFWTESAMRFGAEVAAIDAKIRSGGDLKAHLSPNISGNGFSVDRRRRWEPMRDLALNAFGLHHLHLRDGGGNHLVFVSFDQETALFLMCGDHKSFDDGSLADAAARVQVGMGYEIRGTLGSANPRTPKERMKLARHGIGTFGEADGKLTIGAMLMGTGDAFRARRCADLIVDRVVALDPFLDDIAEINRLMPAMSKCWADRNSFEWLMQDTGLVLYERHTGALCPVTKPFC